MIDVVNIYISSCSGNQCEGLSKSVKTLRCIQGSDPATDFRGGGFLALENHLYMAHHEPALFAALRWKQRGERSKWEYPFGAAGVNITFMLVGGFGMNTLGLSSLIIA